MISLGEQRDGLCYLVSMNKTHKVNTIKAASTSNTSSILWHKHLGNLSSSQLDLMAKKLLHFPFKQNNDCTVCALAKQIRLPFTTSSISSDKPFELIHCDIWGPFKVPSLSGAKYFLTIVDEFSRFTWVFLMHHKISWDKHNKKILLAVTTEDNLNLPSYASMWTVARQITLLTFQHVNLLCFLFSF